MSRHIVPPPKAEGWFELTPPFRLTEGKIYVCEEIRTFDELVRLGRDVLTDVYLPNGLSEKDYEDDFKKEASIVTLKPIGGEPYYVPSTFILTYPGMKGSGYSTKLIVLEVGLVPTAFSIEDLKVNLAEVVKDSIGVDAIVSEANQVNDKSLTPQQQVELEKARRLAIENYISPAKKVESLEERLQEVIAERDALLAVINGEFIAT